MSLDTEINEAALKAVQKVLGEPVFVSFTDEAMRVRRNLLILAYIAAAYKLSGLQITSFRPLGIEFDSYPQTTIDTVMFVLILYNFINFFWISCDALQEMRIRLTGTRLMFVTTGKSASQHGDYPNDPRQSSLMTWWKGQTNKIGSFEPVILAIQEHANVMHTQATSLSGYESKSLHEKASELRQIAAEINRKLDAMNDLIKAKRIPASLERFENSYRNFSYSQLARWFFIDWGAPISLGIFSLYLTHPFLQIAQRLKDYLT